MEGLIRLLDLLATPLTWVGFLGWHHLSQSVIIMLIYSGIGAYVLARVASGAKAVTAPVSFFVLFACSSMANKYLAEYRFTGSNELQHVMIYTMLGTIAGSLLVLAVLRSAERGEE